MVLKTLKYTVFPLTVIRLRGATVAHLTRDPISYYFNSPCQGADVFTPDPGICQPPFTSYPPPPSRGRGGDDLPLCPLNMGRGGQGSATTCCFTWPLPPSICPPPSVVQGLCGEGDMGQTDFRDKGRRGGTQLLMQSPSRSSYIKSSQRSHSSPQSLQKAG
jgi:hypothetical protein